jgi:flagellar FliL protein
MAEEATAATETPEEAAPKAKKGGLVLTLIAAVASLAAGGGVGAFVVGPRLGTGGGEAAAHGEAAAEESGGGGHGKSEAKASPVYTMDNLVVNPAGTNGTRFLIVSFAVEVANAGLVETLAEHDAEIRDAVLHMLASRTVEQLNDLAARDELKVEVRAKVESLIGASNVHNIFLPQFVLQ